MDYANYVNTVLERIESDAKVDWPEDLMHARVRREDIKFIIEEFRHLRSQLNGDGGDGRS